MSLSEQAWEQTTYIFEAIVAHPFNQEFIDGTLKLDIFAYYLEQDSHYLPKHAACDSIISSTIEGQYVADLIKDLNDTLAYEQVVNQFFIDLPNITKTNLLAPATISYTDYIIKNCASEAVEIAVASILPCLWIYKELGIIIAQNTAPNNPYQIWIDYYTDEELNSSIDRMIDIFNALGGKASEEVKGKMLNAYKESSLWELEFWNDAYYKKHIFLRRGSY